jgi:hypothetical protein
MGIDIGKNSFHVIGLDQRGAIVLRQKWSRGQIEARLANMAPGVVGMEACVEGDRRFGWAQTAVIRPGNRQRVVPRAAAFTWSEEGRAHGHTSGRFLCRP